MKSANKENKIVVLGGGTGMPVLLRGLKKLPVQLSTIVTVADDGGSTGMIRKKLGTPAPGDIRNVIAALSNVDADLEKLFQYRFQIDNGLSGHALGNMVLVAMSSITGDFYSAIKKVSEMFRVKGNIYPVVNESVTLHAEMDDGTIISGESNIKFDKNRKIKRIFLTPYEVQPLPIIIQEILEADLVVISPGSLYTSILPNIIIPEIANALAETTSEVIYVCNIMTQSGETDYYKASDHVKAIYNHTHDNIIDSIIVHNEQIKEEILKNYKLENAFPVEYDKENLLQLGVQTIEDNIVDISKNVIRHNTNKIANLLFDRLNKKINF